MASGNGQSQGLSMASGNGCGYMLCGSMPPYLMRLWAHRVNDF